MTNKDRKIFHFSKADATRLDGIKESIEHKPVDDFSMRNTREVNAFYKRRAAKRREDALHRQAKRDYDNPQA